MTKGTSKETLKIFEAYSQSMITKETIRGHSPSDARALSKAADDHNAAGDCPANRIRKTAPVYELNGKPVDVKSLEVEGVDPADYGDFSDAYFSFGEFEDGSQMSPEELEAFQDQNGELLNDMAGESMEGMGQDNDRDWD